MVLPCVDFMGEDFLVGDAAIQTLRREHAEFRFGHVEPTRRLQPIFIAKKRRRALRSVMVRAEERS
jgi:hypothetical protein